MKHFWKRWRPSGLTCQWAHPTERACYGRVEVYDLITDVGKIAQTRTLCKRHKQEKKKDLDEGWHMDRRPENA